MSATPQTRDERSGRPSRWWLPLAAILAGCGPRNGDTTSIVVLFSVDTLGQAMANEHAWCARLTELVGSYGLSMSCPEGALSPSSWTGEAHTRVMWPQHMEGALRSELYPECDRASVLEHIRNETGGTYIYGADNSMLSGSGKERCSVFRTQFTQGVDELYETHETVWLMVDSPEDERPVKQAIDAFEKRVKRESRSVQLFVNAVEPGGHVPRCWFDPYTSVCEGLWGVLQSAGAVKADDDRETAWLREGVNDALNQYFQGEVDQEMRWRGLMWDAIGQSVAHFAQPSVDDRLERILDAVVAEGRADDLRLVIFSDHGENPCIARGPDGETLACGHNGVTTPYTGFVPVFVSPAELVDTWREAEMVGDDGVPWSLANVSYGLVDSVDLDRPGDWPAPEPAGAASSWNCMYPKDGSGPGGVRVEGDVALRCSGGSCEARTFAIPEGPWLEWESVEPIPEGLQAYGGGAEPDAFTSACSD